MEHTVEEKSFCFAVRIINLCKYLEESKRERVLSRQLLRSGTSIGANIAEAQQVQSRADFIAKLSISLKEAAETNYWLRLLKSCENSLRFGIFVYHPRLQRTGKNADSYH